jgi:transcriptional regulator GlxA family with amidase domain
MSKDRAKAAKKKARRLVRDVERYIEAKSPKPVTIPELVKRFKVNRRTLHRAFISIKEKPPIAYAKWLRFRKVRKALRRAKGGDTVTTIATAHGFTQLGRFSVQYRETFGELPSETAGLR